MVGLSRVVFQFAAFTTVNFLNFFTIITFEIDDTELSEILFMILLTLNYVVV